MGLKDIAAGSYTAKAISHDFGRSKNGKEFVAVLFELLGEEGRNERITWYGFFGDSKWNERIFESLKYAGWDGVDPLCCDGLGSVECEAVIELETYQGVTRPKVAWVNSLHQDFKTPAIQKGQNLTQEEKKRIVLSLRADIDSFRAKNGIGQSAKPTAAKHSTAPASSVARRPSPEPPHEDEPPPEYYEKW